MLQISSLISTYFDPESRKPSLTDSGNDDRLLSSICQELTALALGTTNTASIINAIALLRPVTLKYPLTLYMPPDPAVATVDIIEMAGIDVPEHALSALGDAEIVLRLAKVMSYAFESKAANRSLASEALALSAAWRKTAAALLRAIDAFSLSQKSSAINDTCNQDRVRMLLTSVRDGGSPSVSTTGEMVMLDWTERRSDIRYLVDKQVWVHVNSEHKRANLVDISVSGCGLSNCDGLSSGDMASIELTSGRILTGFVMWARVDRAGLRLLQPLSRNDVLLNPTNSNAARST